MPLGTGKPKIRLPFPRNHRNHALGTLPAALRTEVKTGQLHYLSPFLKPKWIPNRPQYLGSDIPTKSRNAQQTFILRKQGTDFLDLSSICRMFSRICFNPSTITFASNSLFLRWHGFRYFLIDPKGGFFIGVGMGEISCRSPIRQQCLIGFDLC